MNHEITMQSVTDLGMKVKVRLLCYRDLLDAWKSDCHAQVIHTHVRGLIFKNEVVVWNKEIQNNIMVAKFNLTMNYYVMQATLFI